MEDHPHPLVVHQGQEEIKPNFRPYQTEDDFWRMREYLRQVFLLNRRLERSGHVTSG